MATTMLTGSAPARLPRRPVTFFAESVELGDRVQLQVDARMDTRRPRAGMLIVPTVPGAFTISVASADGSVFPNPAVVHVTALVSTPGAEDERVVLPPVSVAGLATIELLLVAPDDDEILLSRPAVAEQLRLSPLGDAAHARARGVLGAARLPVEERREIRVVVDDSVSMITGLRSGRLASAVDVLTGLAPVVGQQQEVAPVLATRPDTPIRSDATSLARAVEHQLGAGELRTGYQVGNPPRGAGRLLRYVITDSVPLDDETVDDAVHYVVLADRNALTPLRLASRHPLTVVSESPERMLGDAATLDDVVRSLMLSVVPTAAGGRA